MYEGQFKGKPAEEPRRTADLRQFRWTDLVAKLAASRELRDELDRVDGGFNAFGEVRRESRHEGKPTVNQAALNDGKSTHLSLGNAADDAVQGDREKE